MKLWIGVLSLLGGSLAVQTGYRYESDDYGLLEIAGACSISAEEANCWGPTGKPNQRLSELVTAHFLANPSSELRLRFKKRNRLLVVRTIARQDAKASFHGELEGKSGIRSSQAATIGHESGQESHRLSWYYPPDDESSTDLTARLTIQLSPSSVLQSKEGSEAKLGSYSVKIMGIAESSTQEVQSFGYGNGKIWRISYSVTGPAEQELPQMQAYPMDSKGHPISAVDKDGNPTKPTQGMQGFGSYPQMLVFAAYLDSGNVRSWVSRVRPDKIGYLALSGSTKRRVTFKDVALESVP